MNRTNWIGRAALTAALAAFTASARSTAEENAARLPKETPNADVPVVECIMK